MKSRASSNSKSAKTKIVKKKVPADANIESKNERRVNQKNFNEKKNADQISKGKNKSNQRNNNSNIKSTKNIEEIGEEEEYEYYDDSDADSKAKIKQNNSSSSIVSLNTSSSSTTSETIIENSSPQSRKLQPFEAVFERSMELTNKKFNIDYYGNSLKIRKELKERREPVPKYFKQSPISPPKKEGIWDKDGRLLLDENDEKKNQIKGDKSDEAKLSPKERKQKIDDFLSRNANFTKMIEKEKRTPSPKKRDFSDFYARQDKSVKTKLSFESPPPKEKPKSYFLTKSKKIAILAQTKLPHEKKEEEYTFMPDLSLTAHYKANGIPITCPEAYLATRDIEINTKRVQQVQNEITTYTYLPEFECSKERTKELAANEQKRKQQKHEIPIIENKDEPNYTLPKPKGSPFVDPFKEYKIKQRRRQRRKEKQLAKEAAEKEASKAAANEARKQAAKEKKKQAEKQNKNTYSANTPPPMKSIRWGLH